MALSSDGMTLRAGLVALALFACKEREAAGPPAAGSGAPGGSGTAAPAVPGPGATRTGTGPTLPAVVDAAPGGGTPREQFTDEARDDAWADATEQAIIDRIIDLDDNDKRNIFVECKTTQCRIDYSAPETVGIADAIARFEDQAGLRGIAQSMYIDMAPADGLGQQKLVVYARFAR
jgi:hypothetical protein